MRKENIVIEPAGIISGVEVFRAGRILFTNKHGLPPEIVRAIMKDRYSDPNERSFDESASTITAPTQQVILTRLHRDNLIIRDVTKFYAAFMGSVAHQVLEDSWHEDMSSTVEQRMYVDFEINGKTVVLSGKLDCFDEPEIRDYKTCKVYKMQKGGFEDWEAGQNTYAYIVRAAGHTVDRLNVWALIGDWKAHEAFKPNYPACQIVKVPLKLWDTESQEAFIHERLQRLADAQRIVDTLGADGLTAEEGLASRYPCSQHEMWQDLIDVVIMKDGASRATNGTKCETREECQKIKDEKYADQPEYKVVERYNKRTRCLDWCDVAHVCAQNLRLCKEEGIEPPVRLHGKPIF
jgi:hypothetical protein